MTSQDWRQQPLDITTAPRRDSKHWKLEQTTWADIEKMLETPDNKKEAGNYVLGRLRGSRRSKTSIVDRSGIALDIDHAPADFVERASTLLPCAFVAHTTFSSTPENPRWRILLPLSRPVLPDEYHSVVEWAMELLGRDFFDKGSVEAERYMFRPATPSPENYAYRVEDGDPLDVESVLENFEEDLSGKESPSPGRNKRDPYEIDGVIGAFNRAYGIAEAITHFELPYESDGDRRWHLVGARAVSGLSEIGPGLVFSHHVSDPAWGRACSAFDLVRLHRFGDLDDGISPQTPVNRLPSNQAMLELASTDEMVVRELIGSDFASELDDIADTIEGTDWKLRLALHTKSGAVLDKIKNWDLIVNHDTAFAGLAFNEITFAIETQKDLPWRTLAFGGPTFTSSDRAEMNHYIERVYGIRPAAYIMDGLILAQASRRRFHPVRSYLDSLEWDGVNRVEECLPGVINDDYTRMVARKCLTAAVARVYNPGTKWDHILVLQGAQNIGKTYWTHLMSKGFSAPLGRIDNKDTLLAIHRSWIVMADEGYSLRKADSDQMKEFLTRTEDVFRLPFERETIAYKRGFVIWSTTNDETFLRNEEGNRRYLPVQCTEKVDFSLTTDYYIDQVWAEAKHLFLNDEPLFLDEKETAVTEQQQEKFTEEDVVSGIIQNYLETRVPADWNSMSPESRYTWRQELADGMVPAGTERIDEVCSAQLWVEAFGRRLGDQRRADLLIITGSMKRMPGWEAMPSRNRVQHYGPQLTFRRIGAELGDLL